MSVCSRFSPYQVLACRIWIRGIFLDEKAYGLVYITLVQLVTAQPNTYEFNFTVSAGKSNLNTMTLGRLGIKYITITVNAEGTIVTRSGISIDALMIFTD